MNAAQERKLLKAADQIAQYVADGALPTEAVIKVAQELQLRPGEIKLVANAYNTGATRGQLDSSSDPLQKAAEFPLASAEDALATLFPSTVKTAADVAQSTAVSLDYAISPRGMLQRHKQAAAATLPAKSAPRATYEHPDTFRKYAVAAQQQRKRAVEESRRLVSLAMDKMAQAFCDLVEYFDTPLHVPLSSVKQAARTVYGREGEIVLEKVGNYRPHLQKEAAKPYDYRTDSQPLPLIGRVLAAVEHHSNCGAEYYKQAALAEAAVIHNRPNPFPNSVIEHEKQAVESPLALMLAGSYAKDMIDKTVQGMPEARAQDAAGELSDPQNEAALRNIRIRAMLNDLMAEDPVISRHQPNDVLQAYNDLNGLAPHAADQKLIMQSALRRQLEQGHAEPFEVDQLLGIDSKLRQHGGAAGASSSVL